MLAIDINPGNIPQPHAQDPNHENRNSNAFNWLHNVSKHLPGCLRNIEDGNSGINSGRIPLGLQRQDANLPGSSSTGMEDRNVEISIEGGNMPLQPQAIDPDDENPNGYNWPSRHLLNQNNEALFSTLCVPLYEAALNGNWAAARTILVSNNPELPRSAITRQYETILHVAVSAKQSTFVRELVNSRFLEKQDFTLQDRNGNTAFCLAAVSGNLEIGKLLVERNRQLPGLHGALNMTPLYMAIMLGHRKMAWFIYDKVEIEMDGIEWEHCCNLFFTCLDHTDLFDLALEIFRRFPNLAMERKNEKTALHILAGMPSAFASDSPSLLLGILTLIKKCWGSKDLSISMQKKVIGLVRSLWAELLSRGPLLAEVTIKSGPFSALTEAARLGNWRFISEIVTFHSRLLQRVDNNNETIFHVAVSYRQESIFKQIHTINSVVKDAIVRYETVDGDNMLHLAATLPPPSRLNIVSGAILQMQRELRWFKVVQHTTEGTSHGIKEGKRGFTPEKLFGVEHEALQKEGEEWMKETAKSCTIVTTLIAMVVFATAFSIPGGTRDDGFPHDIKYNLFHVFSISAALALSLAMISTFIFLSMLTSRYAQEDFKEKLPLKIIAGFFTLLVSVIAMMVTFSAAILLAYHSSDQHKVRWIPFLTAALCSAPPAVFVVLQSSLLCEFMKSIFSGSMFHV